MSKLSPEQLGICSWSTQAETPSDLMSRLDAIGLKKVQLALVPLINDPAWHDAKTTLENSGYQVVSGMFGTVGEDYSTVDTIRETGGFLPDSTWEENRKIAKDTADLANALGLELVSTHAGFIPEADEDQDGWDKMVDRLTQVAEIFADAGLVLLFETGQETAENLNHFLDVLAQNGAGNVGVNFDPANMILYDKGDPVESLQLLMPRVRQVHIKDAVRTKTPGTWGTEVPIGDGEVDWVGFLKVLADADYDAGLIIEREAGEDRVGDVRTAIDLISAAMERVG